MIFNICTCFNELEYNSSVLDGLKDGLKQFALDFLFCFKGLQLA